MTPKEAKAYLMRYRESLDRTNELTTHLNELKVEAQNLRDHEGQRTQLDAAVAEYVDACDDAASYLKLLTQTRREIVGIIDSVPDKKLQELLRWRYINGKTLVQIAADRDQSYEHICRLHGIALCAVSKLLP